MSAAPPDETKPYDHGELLVIQHGPTTGPSALTEVLDARADQRPWRLWQPATGMPAPALDRVRGVLVLGGEMGVDDTDAHPWLDDEVALLRDARAADIPTFGICLGAQLLAVVGGGEVEERAQPEVAYLPLERTEAAADDPVFAGWPDGATALFFHDDEVTALPDGAVVMLTGSDGTSAWRSADGLSHAVQFHPEVDAAQVGAWCREVPPERLAAAGVDPDEFAVEATRRDPFHRATGLSLVGRWLDAVVGKDDPDPKRGRRARAAAG